MVILYLKGERKEMKLTERKKHPNKDSFFCAKFASPFMEKILYLKGEDNYV